jgi:FkbM family methyltransferase
MWHGAGSAARLIAPCICDCGRRLDANTLFVDIGAHIGTHTIYALRTGRFGRAVAFEPEPRNARLLAMNIAENGLSQAVTVVRKAAGAAKGEAMLHLHPRNTGAHAIDVPPSVDGQSSLSVRSCGRRMSSLHSVSCLARSAHLGRRRGL